MMKYALLLVVLTVVLQVRAEPTVNGVRANNVLGGLQQHASFSFVRPGLTQTAFAFNGPSSHQAFSSSVGNPHLAQRVLPNVAHALAYRNPGLGYAPIGQITSAYAAGPSAPAAHHPQQLDYQQQQALALAYQQQLQQYQQYHQQHQQYQQQYQQQQQQYQQQQQQYSDYAQQIQAQSVDAATQQSVHEAHLARLLAAQAQSVGNESTAPEQIQLQQQQTANLLGVAYSAAPSVAHVKVNGNGYKFDF